MNRRSLLRATAGGLLLTPLAASIADDPLTESRSFVAPLFPSNDGAGRGASHTVGIASLSIDAERRGVDCVVRLSESRRVRDVRLYEGGENGPTAYRTSLAVGGDGAYVEGRLFEDAAFEDRSRSTDADAGPIVPFGEFVELLSNLEGGRIGLEVRGTGGTIRGRFDTSERQ